MPDANYNTRLRTHAQILPPRRLRQSPCPPLRRPRSHKHRSQPSPAPPTFPPPNALIHHDDLANKTFLAVGRALSSIQNRAITIKDLSRLVRDHGLPCQNVSAASQAITTFIRQHLQRCRDDGSPPLLLSVVLTGIREYDDPLAPALHSRSGGNSPQLKDTAQALTKFRKGTTVWFLSAAAGVPCPFAREGISIDDILARPPHGNKRKRDSQANGPRKMQASTPAMVTRHQEVSHPKIKLTLRVRPPEPESESESEPHSSSESGDESTDSNSEVGAEIPHYSSDISDESGSEAGSSMDLDDTDRVSSEDLPGYPYTPCIPTPNYSTPLTSVPSSATPCGPLSPYLKSNLCSSHFIKSTLTSFRPPWSSNPPDDRATSLPYSAPSSPDSEDEDEDYHNSMVGMRRDSRSLPLKEEDDDERSAPMFEPIVPKYVPGGVHYAKQPSSVTSDSDWSSSKQEVNSETVSTPLETLPGFLSLVEPMSSQISIKEEEPASAILPPSDIWISVKIEEEVDHNDSRSSLASPVCMDDVEVLGPESVRIREWDAAWNAAGHVMDLDEVPLSPPSSEHQNDSPPMSFLTSPISRASMPLNHEYISIDKTVIDDVPVYRTFLAPGLPLLRRVDNSHVNLNPLISFLNISLAALFVHVTTPRMTISSADGPLGGTWVPLSVADKAMCPFDAKLPPRLREVFLVTDLEKMIHSAREAKRLSGDGDSLGVNASSFCHASDEVDTLGTDASIRVEDLFEGDHHGGHTHRQSSSSSSSSVHELWWEAQGSSSAAYFSLSAVRAQAGTPVESLNEQEERIFYSLVDVVGPQQQQQQWESPSVSTARPTPPPKLYLSDLCSPLSTPPSSPVLPSHGGDKENANVSKRPRKKRDNKTEKAPLRRSTRMSTRQSAAGPTTRRRSRKDG